MTTNFVLLVLAAHMRLRGDLSYPSLALYSPVSRTFDGDVGHRSGFFYDFKAEEVVVRSWNREEETM